MKCNCKGCCKECAKIEGISEFLRVVAEPNRLRVLCLLLEGSRSAGEISEGLDIPHNLVSFHLKTLLEAGFLKRKSEGSRNIYSIVESKRESIKELITLC